MRYLASNHVTSWKNRLSQPFDDNVEKHEKVGTIHISGISGTTRGYLLGPPAAGQVCSLIEPRPCSKRCSKHISTRTEAEVPSLTLPLTLTRTETEVQLNPSRKNSSG